MSSNQDEEFLRVAYVDALLNGLIMRKTLHQQYAFLKLLKKPRSLKHWKPN
jgi:hypothetical protein